MRQLAKKKVGKVQQNWCHTFTDIGYALGKENVVFLLFEERRKTEVDNIWTKHVDPFNDFIIKFIEDRNSYSLIMFRDSFDGFGFYKQGFDIDTQYSNFKSQLNDSVLFRYGIQKGKDWQLSSNYKMILNVSIMEKEKVVKGSIEWSAMKSLKENDHQPK